MSIRRRKKAIGKVVKLLNLATSTNASESTVALRHAESLIRQYSISQRELPMLQLCDRSMLYRVSWGNAAPRFAKERSNASVIRESVHQRRFSEKVTDPNKAYASVRTILDDWADLDGGSLEDDDLTEVADHESEESVDTVDANSADKVNEQMENVHLDIEQDERESEPDVVSSSDNVIDAARAFRPDVQGFTDTLRTQYSTSDPSIAFSEDKYWSKVYEKLVDFDEAKVQTEMDRIKLQLQLAEESLQIKKSTRYEREQEELQERSERARIEQSFEEAIERAFQSRAKAYEAWEAEQSKMRLFCLREEQEALIAFEELTQNLEQQQESFKQHIQRKEDYRAAKIMHELRRQLALSVSSGGVAAESYQKVIDIMAENALTLKDLEFSDIKNKSLFIRLLERETALIEDLHERELYTEEMLDKFLTASASVKRPRPSENPLQHIQRLLTVANQSEQFETQKSLEQVMHLMGMHGIGVRDIGYEFIKKYSVFISLINWEAERISSLSEREAFTAEILEEYVQHSVQVPAKTTDKQINRSS